MKTLNWRVEDKNLVCEYENYNGKKGIEVFIFDGLDRYGDLRFVKPNTKIRISGVQYCNMTKSYTALNNNSKLPFFVNIDLSTFNHQKL